MKKIFSITLLCVSSLFFVTKAWSSGSHDGWKSLQDVLDKNYSHADLQEANFRSADFRFADFHMADLRGADLRGAKVDPENAKYLKSKGLSGFYY